MRLHARPWLVDMASRRQQEELTPLNAILKSSMSIISMMQNCFLQGTLDEMCSCVRQCRWLVAGLFIEIGCTGDPLNEAVGRSSLECSARL